MSPDPRRSLPFDRVAKDYDESRSSAVRGAATATALRPHLPDGGVVVEVGVGTGAVAAELAARGVRMLGLDLSLPMLEQARERLGPVVAQADAGRLPLGDGVLAAACTVWVLHVVADVPGVLAEIARVLPPAASYLLVGSQPQRTHSDLADLAHELWDTFRPEGRADEPHRVVPLAAAAGLRLARRDVVELPESGTSPAEAVASIEKRMMSVLWDLDDDDWARTVVPLLERMRALPDQERPRPNARRYNLMVFTRD